MKVYVLYDSVKEKYVAYGNLEETYCELTDNNVVFLAKQTVNNPDRLMYLLRVNNVSEYLEFIFLVPIVDKEPVFEDSICLSEILEEYYLKKVNEIEIRQHNYLRLVSHAVAQVCNYTNNSRIW